MGEKGGGKGAYLSHTVFPCPLHGKWGWGGTKGGITLPFHLRFRAEESEGVLMRGRKWGGKEGRGCMVLFTCYLPLYLLYLLTNRR